MQDLFKPKFISLVDCNEKQLIVMLWTRQTFLQANQILNAQVLVVGEQGIGAVVFGHLLVLGLLVLRL